MAPLIQACHAQKYFVLDDRHIDSTFKLTSSVIADRALHITAKGVRGLLSAEEHGAAGGAAAEQNPLRALQHLDGLKVIKGAGGPGAPDLNLVDVR